MKILAGLEYIPSTKETIYLGPKERSRMQAKEKTSIQLVFHTQRRRVGVACGGIWINTRLREGRGPGGLALHLYTSGYATPTILPLYFGYEI